MAVAGFSFPADDDDDDPSSPSLSTAALPLPLFLSLDLLLLLEEEAVLFFPAMVFLKKINKKKEAKGGLGGKGSIRSRGRNIDSSPLAG